MNEMKCRMFFMFITFVEDTKSEITKILPYLGLYRWSLPFRDIRDIQKCQQMYFKRIIIKRNPVELNFCNLKISISRSTGSDDST